MVSIQNLPQSTFISGPFVSTTNEENRVAKLFRIRICKRAFSDVANEFYRLFERFETITIVGAAAFPRCVAGLGECYGF